MSLYNALKQREAAGRPIRIGVIGAGTFGSMFLAQARRTPGMKLVGIAELALEKAAQTCLEAGWPREAIGYENSAGAINDGAGRGRIILTDNAEQLIKADLDIIIESTGIAEAGTYHAWIALENGKHVVMVNIEAGALLGRVRRERGAYEVEQRASLYRRIEQAAAERHWRAALKAMEELVAAFPSSPEADAARAQMPTVADNARLEEVRELRDRIADLIGRRRFAEAAELARDLIDRFPDTAAAEDLRKQLDRLDELAKAGEGAGQ